MGLLGSLLAKSSGASRRSIENPGVPIDAIWEDHPYFDSLTGGNASESGVKVTVTSGLSYPPVWRAVDLISTYVAKLPIHLYEREDDGGKRRAVEHPAYRLIRREPNEYMTAFHFIKTLVANMLWSGRGNGYALIERDGAADPIDLLWLDPGQITPVRRNGELWYIYGDAQAKLRAENVIHFKGLGYDGLVGYDVVTYMRQALGLGIGLRKFGSVFFKNHATPGVVLERPADAPALSEQGERRIVERFDKMTQGLDAAHRTVVIQEGTKAYTIGVDAQKAQLKELREFEAREVAVMFGLPPHKLGDTTRTAYASLEQENQSLLDDCLDGILVNIEQELSRKLLREVEKDRDSHYIEFLRDALVRADLKTTVETLVMEVNNGIRNLDEARAVRNLPALPDGLGQTFRIPSNIMEMGDDEPEPEPEPMPPIQPPVDPPEPVDGDDPDDDRTAKRRSAIEGLVVDVVRRMHRRTCGQAERAAKKPAEWVAFCEGLAAENRAVWVEAMTPAVAVLDAEYGLAESVGDLADRYYRDAAARLLDLADCQSDELPARVKAWTDGTLVSGPREFVRSLVKG